MYSKNFNYVSSGLALIKNGFSITPTIPNGKRAVKPDWVNLKIDEKLFLEDINKSDFRDCGVGILTAFNPVLDVDCLNLDTSREILQLLINRFGDNIIRRVGKAPKFSVVFRTDKPFTKKTTNIFKDSEDLKNQVEFLGKGQQMVAYGIHEKTKEPYKWLDIRDNEVAGFVMLIMGGQEVGKSFINKFLKAVFKDQDVAFEQLVNKADGFNGYMSN